MPLSPKPNRREVERRVIERTRAHRLFHRMVSRQGIDLTGRWSRGLEAAIFRALGKCTRCADARACRRWLDSEHPLASYVAFCPNAELIETCRILDPNALPPSAGPQQAPIIREPSLTEIMADPIIKLIAASDDREEGGEACRNSSTCSDRNTAT